MGEDVERWHLIALMVGHQVFVEHLRGPSLPDAETVDRVVHDEEVLRGVPEARTSVFYLMDYSDFGIEVRKNPEALDTFIAWGAVLAIYGPTREEMLQAASAKLREEEEQRRQQTEPPEVS